MNSLIIYDSMTGTTAKAAQAMGTILQQQGHTCQVESLSQVNPAQLSEADLICIGSWVKGLFIIRQHPTEGIMRFIEQSENLAGKDVLLFCTYKLAVGSTLEQMARALESKGANVVGKFKYRGPEPDSKFTSFAASL